MLVVDDGGPSAASSKAASPTKTATLATLHATQTSSQTVRKTFYRRRRNLERSERLAASDLSKPICIKNVQTRALFRIIHIIGYIYHHRRSSYTLEQG